jgi:hypothetical protein
MRTPQLECALVERHRMLRLPGRRRSRRRPHAIAMLTSHPPMRSHARRHQVSERRPAHRPIMAQIKARMQCRPSHSRRVIQHTTATPTATQLRARCRDSTAAGLPASVQRWNLRGGGIPPLVGMASQHQRGGGHALLKRRGSGGIRRSRPAGLPGGSPIHGLRALQSAQEPSGRSAASNCRWRLSREPADRGKAILNLPPVLGGGCLARQVPRGCLLAVDPALIRTRVYRFCLA